MKMHSATASLACTPKLGIDTAGHCSTAINRDPSNAQAGLWIRGLDRQMHATSFGCSVSPFAVGPEHGLPVLLMILHLDVGRVLHISSVVTDQSIAQVDGKSSPGLARPALTRAMLGPRPAMD